MGDQDDSICFEKFPSREKVTYTILECLDYKSLKSLMLTNNFWLKRVKEYLADDAPWMRLCVKELLIDRSQNDSLWKETYREFQKEKKTMVDIRFEYNCLSLREMHVRIWEDFLSSAASGSGLCRILHGLDMKRKPTNMEIYTYCLAKKLQDPFKQFQQLTKKRNFGSFANFRTGWEFALAPKEYSDSEDNSFYNHLFKIVHIIAIRHKILDECTVSPFHGVFTHEISKSFSKEIMNITSKAGSSYSYNTDLTHSRRKHDEWEKGGRKAFAKVCPTNAMLEEHDNLETKMKHANAHNAEKLHHFINKQAGYVEGFKVDLDMYCKPSRIALPKASYLLTKEEEIDVNNFRQSVLSKANEVAHVYD